MQRVAAVVVAAVVGSSAMLYAQSAETGPSQVVKQYEAAYNKGDAQALGALFTDNALRLASDGRVLAGRAAIEKDAATALAGERRGSQAAIQVGRTQQLTPDVALVEGTFEVTGASTPVKGRYLLTVVRDSGRWRIASITTATPSMSASR